MLFLSHTQTCQEAADNIERNENQQRKNNQEEAGNLCSVLLHANNKIFMSYFPKQETEFQITLLLVINIFFFQL